ncbi:ROK family protein [Actinospica robiniae]|uniref:ROK family protein n=1 Tax=Actinospica robiniae TaxID=304901 RepID=UPI0004081434|nr:ROK family protein [Actinospica robiniae]
MSVRSGGAALAVDIGGTKLAAALVDSEGQVLRRNEVPTPKTTVAEQAGDALIGLIRPLLAGADRPVVAAVASAGPLDPRQGTISPVNIPAWRSYPVLEQVGEVTGSMPSVLLGDALAAAVGEQWRGAATGSGAMLGVVVSTGVGGGFVFDGRPFAGPTGNAGHLGHMCADPLGQLCPCGARGCVEMLASGPSMVRWARGMGWPGHEARQLAVEARSGRPLALAAFGQAAEALSLGIAAAAALCDLDDVVVGGGVSQAGEILLGPLRRCLAARTALEFVRRIKVHQSALGTSAGLIGAARAGFQLLADA